MQQFSPNIVKRYISKRNNFVLIKGKSKVIIKTNDVTLHYLDFINQENISPEYMYMFNIVAKEIEQYIAKNFNTEKGIEQIVAKNTGYLNNYKLIKKNLNKTLPLIDVNHCYWQVAYKLGYITKETYRRFKKPKYKLMRNMSLASITSPKISEVYILGSMIATFKENKRYEKLIYDNIRSYTFNLFEELFEFIGGKKNNVLKYRIDGAVLVNDDVLKKAKMFFEEKGIEYKISTVRLPDINKVEKLD